MVSVLVQISGGASGARGCAAHLLRLFRFALIREPAGGVDPEPTEEDPHPKLTRLRKEFSDTVGDADGNVWDPFALELINASAEEDIKRRDLYDGAPLLATLDP